MVYFGNIAETIRPWRAANCANMRQPSVAHRAPAFDRLGAASLHGHESERMGFISELRYPTTWYSKLVIAILALVFFGLLAAAAISGYLVYQMVLPAQSHSEIDLQNFPGHPQVTVL